MKVILSSKVETLGNVGEIVNVSPGYARNYLIPNRFAVVADESNKKQMDHYKKMLANKISGEVSAANDLKSKIDGLSVELIKKVGGSGKLFGAVTNHELAKELAKQDIVIERRLILLGSPIKALGAFDVNVKIFSGIEASFKVNVVMDPKQAEEIKAKQADLEKKALLKEEALKNGEEAESEEEVTDAVEMTEEEKLKEEANKILRSF